MRWARTVGMTGSAVAVAAMVTACEKPPPSITVWSGTHSVSAEALCWSFEETSLGEGQCAEDILQGSRAEGLPSLPAQPGNTLGISVDPVVAEAGWQIRAQGQPVVPETLETKYYRVTTSTPGQPVTLQVVAGREAQVQGVWLVALDVQQ
jgi:hypothetical protein